MAKIQLNGKKIVLKSKTTLFSLLKKYKLDKNKVAIELNGEIIDIINYNFYSQLTLIGPFGIMNPTPIFWARKCKILDIYKLKGDHLKMTLNDGTSTIEAIKWNGSIELKVKLNI